VITYLKFYRFFEKKQNRGTFKKEEKTSGFTIRIEIVGASKTKSCCITTHIKTSRTKTELK